VVADPVIGQSFLGLQRAEPQEDSGTNRHPSDAQEKSCFQRRHFQFVLALSVLLLMVVAVVAVPLVLSLKDSGGEDNVPQLGLAESQMTASEYLLTLLPSDTRNLIQPANDSHQSMAFLWLLDDPNIKAYTDMRLVQRFVLSTLYFATGEVMTRIG
jgi:hypothetical protein